ncbi:MAG TPA: amidohydrolase family protein [Acidimicrobiales bacterium]|nr:amidohydrolase family protein [Acidimicrobiales bacterium]
MPDGYFAPSGFHDRPGRVDPVARISEMAIDGVDGEVLYPSLALELFALDDASLQERTFARYNSWLMEFCEVKPEALIGIGLVSMYNMDIAVKELERCAEGGLRGCQIWQSPHASLPLSAAHYEPFWEAAASLNMPVSLHILTGFNYSSRQSRSDSKKIEDPIERSIDGYKGSVTRKLDAACDAIVDIMFGGALDRHPNLKLVTVENEIGWIPFVLNQFDYYCNRFRESRQTGMSKLPSEYFGSQVFSTFFRDPVGMKLLGWWKGAGGCMWSNDYPHPNSTWPHSQEIVAENLSYLNPEIYRKVVRETAMNLYSLHEAR